MNVQDGNLASALSACAEYRGSELYSAVVKLMDCLIASYKEDLLTVTADKLQFKQGAAAQASAIREALIEASPREQNFNTPKV